MISRQTTAFSVEWEPSVIKIIGNGLYQKNE